MILKMICPFSQLVVYYSKSLIKTFAYITLNSFFLNVFNKSTSVLQVIRAFCLVQISAIIIAG